MGAHSGSNSDDLIYLISAKDKNNMVSFSFNRERHGIKSMDYPEIKSEIILSYQRNIFNNHFLFFVYEHEIQFFIEMKCYQLKPFLVWLFICIQEIS